MTWTELGNPSPREQALEHPELRWPDGLVRPLEADPPACTEAFDDVLARRRSSRTFAPLSAVRLSGFLSRSCRPSQVGTGAAGQRLSRRPAPSAGALHPIHLVLSLPEEKVWLRYDPWAHHLVELASPIDPREVRAQLVDVLPGGDSVLLLLAAEPGLTAAKYHAAQSLVWRDAGVLQGHMALVAAAMRLNFCLLGVTGDPWTGSLVDQGGLHGVGVAYLGGAPAQGLPE